MDPNRRNNRRISHQNRGPGDILAVNGEAGRIRNSLSNTQTAAKKAKLTNEVVSEMAKGTLEVAKELGGSGAISGSYFEKRHTLSRRGEEIQEEALLGLEKAGFMEGQAGNEGLFLMAPKNVKFNVGVAYQRGTNKSAKTYTTKQNVAFGLKGALKCDISPERALRLANLGVSMLDMVSGELAHQANQNWLARATAAQAAGNPVPPQPPAPTEDEIKAALQLSILLAFKNRNKVPAERLGVDASLNNLEDI